MKTTHVEHEDWSEDIFEPDDAPTGDGKAGASASGNAWPVLDAAAYHGLAGEVVTTILPHTEADPVALLLQTHVSFGNVVGRQPYYFIEGAEHYPVLFALLAGPTAKGRKGTAANRIRPIFDVADCDWAHNNVTSGISSGEGILHAIHDDIYGTDKRTGLHCWSRPASRTSVYCSMSANSRRRSTACGVKATSSAASSAMLGIAPECCGR